MSGNLPIPAMRTVYSHSDHPGSEEALQELLHSARERLAGEVPRAGLLFCSVEYDHATILAGIQREWPGLPVIGASSDGELSSALGCCDDSVLLTLFSGDELKVHAGVGRGVSEDIPRAVAEALEGSSIERPTLCVTTFAPSTNSSEVLRELSRHMGDARCPIVGGLSGDHREFTQTTEYFGSEALRDAFPLLLLGGRLRGRLGRRFGLVPGGGTERRHAFERARGPGDRRQDRARLLPQRVRRRAHGQPGRVSARGPRRSRQRDAACHPGPRRRDGHAALRRRGAGGCGGASHAGPRRGHSPRLRGRARGCARPLRRRDSGARPRLLLRGPEVGPRPGRERGDRSAPQARERPRLQELGIVGLYCFGEIAPAGDAPDQAFHNETCVSVVLGPR